MGQELGALPPLWGRELGPHITQCRLGRGLPLYQVASWSIHQQTWAENWGGLCLLFRERWGWVPIKHNVAWAEAYVHTKWQLDASSRLATIEMGRGDGAGSPSNTMWPGPRSTCVPSFILIHPTVWPQYTNITNRIYRTDRQADRQTPVW